MIDNIIDLIIRLILLVISLLLIHFLPLAIYSFAVWDNVMLLHLGEWDIGARIVYLVWVFIVSLLVFSRP